MSNRSIDAAAGGWTVRPAVTERDLLTGAVIGSGVVFGAVEAVHVREMLRLVGPVGVVVESVLPLALAVVLAGVGAWLRRSALDAAELRRVVGWMAAVAVGIGLLFAWTISHQRVGVIREQVDDVVDTVERVKTLTRAIDERSSPALEPRDLSRTVRREVERARDAHGDARIHAAVPDGVTVRADELLPSVVENLLVNAIAHSDRETPGVDVAVDPGEGTATLRVADDGPGVPADLPTTLDDWEVDANNRVAPEVGIGLAIVATAVDRYGGDLRIDDREPRGTVVEVDLSLAAG